MNSRISPYILLLLAVLLAACGTSAQPAASRQEQTVDNLTIALEAADQPVLNATQEFVITLTDAKGQPVNGASVYLDLTMRTMPMGTSRPIAADEGQGRYRTQAAYTMTGEWDIVVVAEVADNEHRAVFNRVVVETTPP